MSAEQEEWVAAAERRATRTADTSDAVLDAVRRAQMAPEQDILDDLMDEKSREASVQRLA